MDIELDGKELYNQLRSTYTEDLKNGSKIQTKQAYRQEIKDIEDDFENVIPSSFYFGIKDFLRDFKPHGNDRSERLIDVIQMSFRPIYRWHDMDFINVDNLFFPGNEYTLLLEFIEAVDLPNNIKERLKSKIEAVQGAHADGFKRRIDQLALKSCLDGAVTSTAENYMPDRLEIFKKAKALKESGFTEEIVRDKISKWLNEVYDLSESDVKRIYNFSLLEPRSFMKVVNNHVPYI